MTSAKTAANRKNAKKSTGPRTATGKAIASTNALRHGLLAALPVLPGVESLEAWEAHREAVVTALSPVGYVETTFAGRIASLIWRIERVTRYETERATSGIETAQADVEHGRDNPFAPDHAIGTTREQIAEAAEMRAETVRAFVTLREAGDDDGISADDVDALLDAVASGTDVDLDDLEFSFLPDEVNETGWGSWDGWTKKLVLDAVAAIDAEAGALGVAELRARHQADKAAKALQAFDAEVTRKVRSRLLLADDRLEAVGRYEAHLDRCLFKTLHELQRLRALRDGDARALPAALDVDLAVGPHAGANEP